MNSQVLSVQEFSIRVPKNLKKKHHVMRFNGNLNVDFTQWRNVKMERENNLREFKGNNEEDAPKFGAGSEYNRDLKEEVRRKKYGIIAKRYRPEAQPWILKVGGRSGKKFRGIREGGVSDNASFYVFTHAPDGAIEAYPLNEWYNFQPIQRYKTLTAEEAEHELSNRKKTLNLFALMLRKRMKGEEEDDPDIEGDKKKGAKKKQDFTISEMDEWMNSDDDDDSSNNEEEEKKSNGSDSEKQKKKKGQVVKKKKKDVDDEAFEDSDDGDEEGRELDYISDSSESDSELEAKGKDLKSVAEEDGLRNLLTSEEEDEEGEKKSGDDSNKSDGEKNSKEGKKDGKEKEDKKKKKKKKKGDNSSSNATSNSSDSDEFTNSSKKKKKKDKTSKHSVTSRSASPNTVQDSGKRKLNMPTDLTTSENSNSPISTPAKKTKLDTPLVPSSFAGVINTTSRDDYGITEEAVRRYLMRKPMTTIELLTKFKNKKTGVSSDKLVETMTQILKKINPVKQTIQGKMYLSIKGPK